MPHAPAAGVLLTASLHAYATVRSAVEPHEYLTEFGPSPEHLAEGVLPRSGAIRLTDKPGLELDERTLDRLQA